MTPETPLSLAGRERELWEALAKGGARYQTRGELSTRLYGSNLNAGSIQSWVMRLRKRLGYDAIENRPGAGYRLAQQPCCPICGYDLAVVPELRAEIARLEVLAATPVRVVRGSHVLWEEDLGRHNEKGPLKAP